MLQWSTFLGGSSAEEGSDIVLGVDGLAYVAGTTSSPDFPTTPGALDTSYNGDAGDAFVVEIAPTLCAYYLPLVFRSP